MWSFLVVLFQPLLGLLTDFIQALKHKHVEHGFPIGAIEALNEIILHRLTGLDEFEGHAVLLGPISQRHRHQFWAIVQSQLEWIAASSFAFPPFLTERCSITIRQARRSLS